MQAQKQKLAGRVLLSLLAKEGAGVYRGRYLVFRAENALFLPEKKHGLR